MAPPQAISPNLSAPRKQLAKAMSYAGVRWSLWRGTAGKGWWGRPPPVEWRWAASEGGGAWDEGWWDISERQPRKGDDSGPSARCSACSWTTQKSVILPHHSQDMEQPHCWPAVRAPKASPSECYKIREEAEKYMWAVRKSLVSCMSIHSPGHY